MTQNNKMTLNELKKLTEEKFEKEFPHKIAGVIDDFGDTTKSDFQSFLLQSLDEAYKLGEENVAKKMLEKMSECEGEDSTHEDRCRYGWKDIKNILSDLLQELNK